MALKMSAKKKWLALCVLITTGLFSLKGMSALSSDNPVNNSFLSPSLARNTLAQQLGWVVSDNQCGGYYFDRAFVYPMQVEKNNLVEITSNQSLFSQKSTSVLEGKVTVTREGQQITANKAFLYRDPLTGKLSTMDMIGDVNLREPNTLIVGKSGHYNFDTKAKSLRYIFYRTALSGKQVAGPKVVPYNETQKARKITTMTAWGRAYEFYSNQSKVYELTRGSFSTCPPINPAWRLKASHIVLNKNTGRGYATHARLLIKNIPVLYLPYLNFSIDGQRKSGFLWPKFGVSNKWGPYFLAPFYWNMAPNYDMTITPGYLAKRGYELSDEFRYLSTTSHGDIFFNVLPYDQFFRDFQLAQQEEYGTTTNPVLQAELNRLEDSSDTRIGAQWLDKSQYTPHWSSDVNFNYASDDYYMRDFGNLNEATNNLLLQQADVYYKGENWNFTGRVQAYQTLHPIDESVVMNPYRRLPQLVLNGDYPDQAFGLEYFINTEATHFEILKNPGDSTIKPVGSRFNVQPGVSLPLSWTSFYVNPRFQVALTDYDLNQTADTETPANIQRAVPIFDVATGVSLSRDATLFHHDYQQTLEPQLYYTYIPYRNQDSIPVFDTTVNTLTYDQIFNYNRFTGIDRIGDANQIGLGVTTRLIDQDSGLEKVRLGVGNIIYFADRRVTLCNNSQAGCTDYPENPTNHYRVSPVSGTFKYMVNPVWNLSADSMWNPITKQIDKSTFAIHYQPDERHIINVGFTFVRNGDYFTGLIVNNAQNNLKLTDFSAAWPLTRDVSMVGRWTEDWNTDHFQNLLYGLQYDSCCWAVRLVGGRAFTNLDSNNQPVYNSEVYLQFALKGLGNVGKDPTTLLSTISGYASKFG